MLDNGTCTARHATLPLCSVLLAAVTRCGEDGNQATVQGRRGMPCTWVWVGQFGIGPYVMRSLPAFAGGPGCVGCEACTWSPGKSCLANHYGAAMRRSHAVALSTRAGMPVRHHFTLWMQEVRLVRTYACLMQACPVCCSLSGGGCYAALAVCGLCMCKKRVERCGKRCGRLCMLAACQLFGGAGML